MNELVRPPETGAAAPVWPRHHRKNWLLTPEAADYLTDISGVRICLTTLETWRTRPPRGGGPRFRRFGKRVVYARTDLDAWHMERLSAPMRSTSDVVSGD
ncbi:DNA-binding protein [Xanthobacter variabilis]|uniref:DNA-binding protein n=1 Tax=Xanthobacter variabilis TaxID=3119932 RepID=UPI0037291D3B